MSFLRNTKPWQVCSTLLMILRRRDLALDDVPSHDDVPALPIDIAIEVRVVRRAATPFGIRRASTPPNRRSVLLSPLGGVRLPRVNGSICGFASSPRRRYFPSFSAGFADKSSSSTACESTTLTVRRMPRTELTFSPRSRSAAINSRQSRLDT